MLNFTGITRETIRDSQR